MAEEKGKKPSASNAGKKEKAKRYSVKKKPKKTFYVPNSTGKRRMKSVKPRWRKQRGEDNKKRQKKAFFGASPKVGNKNAREMRGLHVLGLPEILVSNPSELEGAEEILVRIAAGVGKRKRGEIIKKAEEMNLRVLNKGVKK
ncbi:MAG: eL32 family ribosomal protein [Candidatus Micrarchaeia archaeon]